MGYSLSDLGDDLKSGFDYLVNPFVAAGNDLLEKTGEWIIDKLTPDVDYNDRKLNSRSPTTARRVIYGTARVGGQVVYIDSDGTDSKDLHMVVVLAGHYCDSIDDVYFGETISTDPKYSGKHQLHKSSNGTVPAALLSYLSSKGVNNYKYTNMTYVYCVFDYDDEVYQGIPQITATVKGKQVYDPRTTLTQYSENAALCQLDWIKNYMGATDEFISEQSVIDAANISDELVAAVNGGTEPRFALNGTISQSGSKIESLSKMSVNSGIFPAYRQGQWIFQPQVYVAPEVDAIISETELISDLSVSTGSDKQDKVNTIKGTYIDEATNFEQIEYPTIQTPTYLEEDKEQLEQSIDYPMINSGTQCRRLSKVLLEQSRRSITVSGTFRFSVLDHEIGDRVKLNYAPFGWAEKIFKVTNRDISSFSGVELTLKEDDPDIYAWVEGDALETHVPPFLDLPNADFIAPPTNFALTESLYTANTQAAVKARVNFTWLAGDTSARNYEIQGNYKGEGYQVLSSFISGLEFRYSDIETGDWIFRIRSVNSIGAKSTWVNLSYTVLGKQVPPSNVSSITAAQQPEGVALAWQAITDPDFLLYELRLDEGFGEDGAIYSGTQLNYLDLQRPTGVTYYIRALDTSGNYSDMSAQFTPEITGPNKLSSLVASSTYNNVFLQWSTADAIYPVRTYRIRKGESFDTAEVIGESSGTFEVVIENDNGAFRYWVYAVDVAGNEGPAISTVANVDNPPDYVLRDDDYIDFSKMDTLDNVAVGSGSGGFKWDDTTLRWDDTTLRWDDGPSLDLIGPVNNTESFGENMTRSGLADPEEDKSWDDITQPWNDEALLWNDIGGDPYGKKIENGYTHWLEPALANGLAERIIDFEALIPSSRITVTVETDIIKAGATVTTVLSTSDDGISWIEYGDDQLEIQSSNFQYLRVQLKFDSPTSDGIAIVNSVRFRLDTKQKTDQGLTSVFAADVDGTIIYLNKDFIDIESIVATPKAVDAKIAVATFDDVGNQDQFKVLVFERATGNRVDAQVSWNARGV